MEKVDLRVCLSNKYCAYDLGLNEFMAISTPPLKFPLNSVVWIFG